MLNGDPRYPNLRVLDLRKEADEKRLPLFLSGIGDPDRRGINARDLPLSTPGGLIANLLSPQNPRSIGARGVIVELEYVDRDTNIDYAQLYARAFKDHPRRAFRLLFFGEPINSYKDFSDHVAISRLTRSYCQGYCVVSPMGSRMIGRTVLPPPKGDKAWFFIPTQSEFSSNVAGIPLSATGTAFAQQDSRVAACASAATWMSTVLLARRFNHDVPIRSMSEITGLATKYSLPSSGRGANPGLSVGQILWALQEMGYEPLISDVFDPNETSELVYSSVESGIPAILVIYLPNFGGYHAVTVVGHTYDHSLSLADISAKNVESARVWSPHFIIHDDQMGPYLKVKVDSPNSKTQGRPSLHVDPDDSLMGMFKEEIIKWYSDASIYYVIMPFAPRHTLRPDHAAARARAILNSAFKLYSKRLRIALPDPHFYRTYFISSNEFKRRLVPQSDMAGQGVPGLRSELSRWYRGSSYPRYLWVPELCGMEHRVLQRPEDLRIIADVTLDPTSSRQSPDFVTLHLPHAFFRMLPDSADVSNALASPTAYVKDDTPYQPLVRMASCQPPTLK